jgi:hypothetical protein
MGGVDRLFPLFIVGPGLQLRLLDRVELALLLLLRG